MNLFESRYSQVESEFAALIDLLKSEGVMRFLEVGSRFGGSLWRIANALPKGSRIVSCDSGSGMGGRKAGAQRSLRSCIAQLNAGGYDTHLIIGDSQHDNVVAEVAAQAPFDAAFIDADHEYKGASRDWANYGPMARIVAFHDIAWEKPADYAQSKLVEVPRLWNELKSQYKHREFVDRSNGGNMGIGVLWMS